MTIDVAPREQGWDEVVEASTQIQTMLRCWEGETIAIDVIIPDAQK